MQKIYIVASNVKQGGAGELLSYLLEYLYSSYKDIPIKVYVDHSLNLTSKGNIEIINQHSNYEKIYLFSKSLENVLYFGNLPPLRKSKNAMVYFHNTYLLMNFKTLIKQKFKLFLKFFPQQIYIKFFIRNVDLVGCQTNSVKLAYKKKYGFNNISLFPFYKQCNLKKVNKNVIEYDFCYISLDYPHKNHHLLFDAMEILANRGYDINLIVTINKENQSLISRINDINQIGNVEIINIGILSKDRICDIYQASRCLCFPSKTESFGLPLIEAASQGLDIIAADLDYVYEVVRPSAVFDPYDANDLVNKMVAYLEGKLQSSECLIENKIDYLINNLLKKEV